MHRNLPIQLRGPASLELFDAHVLTPYAFWLSLCHLDVMLGVCEEMYVRIA